MSDKAGLESALDFTKFVITMDGALIAFVTGATFLQDINGALEKGAVLIALVTLVVSIGAGILVAMEVATKLSNSQYDLNDNWVKIPGMANVIAFALGAIAIASLAAFELFLEAPLPSPAGQTFQVHCAGVTAPSPRLIDCTGVINSAR